MGRKLTTIPADVDRLCNDIIKSGKTLADVSAVLRHSCSFLSRARKSGQIPYDDLRMICILLYGSAGAEKNAEAYLIKKEEKKEEAPKEETPKEESTPP